MRLSEAVELLNRVLSGELRARSDEEQVVLAAALADVAKQYARSKPELSFAAARARDEVERRGGFAERSPTDHRRSLSTLAGMATPQREQPARSMGEARERASRRITYQLRGGPGGIHDPTIRRPGG